MSYPSNGSYKSKLFNFINRQSQKHGDRLIIALRHLKVAVQWGLQITLYPIYLLIQTGRMAKYQLGQKTEHEGLSESTPGFELEWQARADRPIREVLNILVPWLQSPKVIPQTLSPLKESSFAKSSEGSGISDKEKSKNSSTALLEDLANNNLVIQGIATLLDNRAVVLVTEENELLNILTKQQQQELKQHIETELIKYINARVSLEQLESNTFAKRLPELQTGDFPLLLPAQLFWSAMKWVQNSPLAMAVNMFEESNQSGSSARYRKRDRFQASPPKNKLADLPEADRDLSEDWQTPGSVEDFIEEEVESAIVIAEVEIVESVEEPMNERLQGLKKELQEKLNSARATNNSGADIPSASPGRFSDDDREESFDLDDREETEENVFVSSNFSAIVRVDRQPGTLTRIGGSSLSFLKPTTRLSDSIGEQLQKIQQNVKMRLQNIQESLTSPEALASSSTQIKSIIQGAVEYFEIRTKKTSGTKKKKKTLNLIPPTPEGEDFDGEIIEEQYRETNMSFSSLFSKPAREYSSTSSESDSSEISSPLEQYLSEEETLEAKPEWLETDSTDMGYVRHPMERVVEWFDILTVWIEKQAVKIWGWIRELGRRAHLALQTIKAAIFKGK